MRKLVMIILAALAFMSACGNSDNANGADSIPASKPGNYSDTSPETSETSGISGGEPEISSDTSQEAPVTSEISGTVTENVQGEISDDKEENAMNIEITVNGRIFSAALYDNETARAFKERLPLTLDMSELNGNEKYYYLPDSLPRNSSRPSGINTGDIMLYGSDCLVIFYESFSTSYTYTPIGKIDDPDGLAAALGGGSVQVTFN